MTKARRFTVVDLETAFDHGRRGEIRQTLSAIEDTPAWQAAFQLGLDYRHGRLVMEPHMAYGCGCPRCRFEKIVRETGVELARGDFSITAGGHWPQHGFSWAHRDYDGPGDNRCGTAATLDEAIAAIDEWYAEQAAEADLAREVAR